MKTSAHRYIPQGAIAETFDDINAVVYRYHNGRPYAIAYSGKRQQPDFHFAYFSEAIREEAIARWVASLRKNKACKAGRAAKRNAFQPSLKVGDILVSSWGYDQTNVDYYEVIALKGKKLVWLRELATVQTETSFMSGHCLPNKGHYIGEPMLRRVGENNTVRVSVCAKAYPWNGKPKHCSWYA